MKRVLILTSVKTGSGHRASANAIEKKLRDKGYETRQLDVFPLMGKMGLLMENSYIPLTTGAPFVYYLCQRFSEYFPWFIHLQMYFRMKKNLLKEIEEYKPDLILSVHCMFTRSVSYLIRHHKLQIPFHIGVIDLIDPPSVWEDRKADMTYVPTAVIRDAYVKKGFAKDRVLVSGFPVRDDIIVKTEAKTIMDHVRILMVNPSTDLKKNVSFLKEVSRLENSEIDFVCGLDRKLHDTLKQLQEAGNVSDNVRIHGFVGNINELMEQSHLILTKAGPNVIMEAIRSDTAIVITGHIKGQEGHNYRYVTENGYGIRCEDPGKIHEVLKEFIGSGELKKCLEHIVRHEVNNGAEYIADQISRTI